MTEDIEALEPVITALREAILACGWARNSCISTTWAIQQLLRHYGIEGRPLVVEAYVANQRWWDHLEAGIDPNPDPEAYALGLGITDRSDEPPWQAQIDRRPGTPSTLNLHLILLTDEWLIDGSLDQASRPRWGIKLEPLGLRLTPEARTRLLAGKGWVITQIDGGVTLGYRGRPANRDYTRAGDWTVHRGELGAIVGAVIRASNPLTPGGT